jgi:DNA modification methylase
MQRNVILKGDAASVLRTLPDSSIHTVVTSPPYFQLRSYLPSDHPEKHLEIGLERSVTDYVTHLVEVFREVKRALRPDGVLWLVIGDCFSGGGRGAAGKQAYLGSHLPRNTNPPDVARRNLIGIPWRVAFALQDDGWILRSDCVWHKKNVLPESVKNRPVRAHEYIFLLAKQEQYFYDYVAVMEPASGHSVTCLQQRALATRTGGAQDNPYGADLKGGIHQIQESSAIAYPQRNLRDVWQISTTPFRGQHYATFPEHLAKTCILAGSSPAACESCGAPWRRIVKHYRLDRMAAKSKYSDPTMQATGLQEARVACRALGLESPPPPQTLGWRPTCACEQNTGAAKCVILDCFAGAGTTLLAAQKLGRDWIGIELNEAYISMSLERIREATGAGCGEAA